ncbi:MAG: DUF4416 family protein [Gemmataceae bacterium]|nr:DUF4416 family protein [Gemmataceae bacterium]
MATPRNQKPALLVVAAFSRHAEALAWARARLEGEFGPVALAGPLFDFTQTAYYEPTMGAGLRKQFLAFRDLVPLDALAAIKLRANELEHECKGTVNFPEPRPLNLDPGLLTLGKFMLATTKDQAHRIYLHDGIFAEITLRFHAGNWEPWPWTYADYRETDVRAFLGELRDLYRRQLAELPG